MKQSKVKVKPVKALRGETYPTKQNMLSKLAQAFSWKLDPSEEAQGARPSERGCPSEGASPSVFASTG